MSQNPDSPSLFLFVPADRPERFAKAIAAGADAVIVDLEDAVAPVGKMAARDGLSTALSGLATTASVFVRINATGTQWHEDDVAAVAAMPVAGAVLPKVEHADEALSLRARLPEGMRIVAIIESARGLAAAEAIAGAVDFVIFGSVDLAADLGCAHSREALLLARNMIVLACRLAGAPAPIDGVTLSIKDEASIEDDARYGASLGFGGKLAIHPSQVGPTRRGLAPSDEEVAWARRVVASAEDGAARAVDGAMVDAPVLAKAQQILRSHDRLSNG